MNSIKNPLGIRYFGLFFFLSFLSYALGSHFLGIVQRDHVTPTEIIDDQNSIILGGFLVVVVHTVCNVMLLWIMFRFLKEINRFLSYVYLSAGMLATLMLALGAAYLLLSLPVSMQFAAARNYDSTEFSLSMVLLTKLNFYLYQFGMMVWGIGGIIFCFLLRKGNIVPVFFPFWGFFGYLVFITGTCLELLGIPYGVYCSIPGGLFELALSSWIISKGTTVNYKIY